MRSSAAMDAACEAKHELVSHSGELISEHMSELISEHMSELISEHRSCHYLNLFSKHTPLEVASHSGRALRYTSV